MNVTRIRLTAKRLQEQDIKSKNQRIIDDLASDGKIRLKPNKKKIYEGSVVEIPDLCFKNHKFYRVGT